MALTEITYYEVYTHPGKTHRIEHTDDHLVTVLASTEHVGGGAEDRWLLRYAISGPVKERKHG